MKKRIAVLFLAAILLLPGCGAMTPKPIKSPAPPSASPPAATTAAPSTAAPSIAMALPSSAQTPPVSLAPPSATPPVFKPSAQPSASGAKSAADYFPVKADTRMVYGGIGNEFAQFDQYVDYIAKGAVQLRTYNGGTETVSVYTVDSGAVTKVFSQNETYYRSDFTAMRTMSEVLIKAPIAVGTTWSLADGSTRSITAAAADVKVPYGSFKALEVTTKAADSIVKDYYAVGVGLVKRVFAPKSDPSFTIESVLEKIETSSTLKQSVRIYYPDFNNSRVAYINKTLEYHTGDKAAAKIEYEFKHAPQGSGLTLVFSQGAAINSISFDTGSGVVTADLSKTFITGMNAGSSLEGLILASLADTLGDYYQTDKVAVTVDGGQYSSGHFLFNKGDLLPYQPGKAVPYK